VTRPEIRRAAGLLATAVVVALVCTGLGYWQWTRHEHRAAAIALVEANYGADPVPLAAVLPLPASTLADDRVWTPVRVTGRYRAQDSVLLRNRPVDGRPGLHVLVPLEVTDAGDGAEGAILVVDRGWIPTDLSPDDVPPPAGEVDVVVRLRADEPASPRDAPAGQVQAISVRQVLTAAGLDPGTPAFRAHGALASETPAPERPLGGLPRPSTDPGSHLSYALQWWTFALGALVGFAILARRELAAPSAAGPHDVPTPARRRRTPSAEDVEDALIDAQLR
jgi:cytochrome oxidase assembly protein ShyY1